MDRNTILNEKDLGPQHIANVGMSTASAMGIMVVAMLFIPIMDILARMLSTQYSMSPASVTMARFIVQSIILCILLVVGYKSSGFRCDNIGFNILRGLLLGGASLLFFVAVKYMPVADAISIFFVEPILVMVLSAIFLRELLGWRRVLAAFVGFCGALLVIQPSFEVFGPVALLPLVTALLFAAYLLLTRQFGGKDNAITMQFYAGLGGVILCAAAIGLGENLGAVDYQFTMPSVSFEWGAIIAIGIISSIGHLMVVVAFSSAPVTTLAPFQYVEIVSATLLGYAVFGDWPTPIKWLGIATIVGSGLYIFYRENRISQLAKAESLAN